MKHKDNIKPISLLFIKFETSIEVTSKTKYKIIDIIEKAFSIKHVLRNTIAFELHTLLSDLLKRLNR
jgi:hypothetical protein